MSQLNFDTILDIFINAPIIKIKFGDFSIPTNLFIMPNTVVYKNSDKLNYYKIKQIMKSEH